ncbi:hypothetical protein EsH8_VIII_000270 [Colletotrichum jinshuiense]
MFPKFIPRFLAANLPSTYGFPTLYKKEPINHQPPAAKLPIIQSSHTHTPNPKPPKPVKMRASVVFVTFLAAAVSAFYDGPCTDTDCGEARVNCDTEGKVCVPFPFVDVERRKGCTCSIA